MATLCNITKENFLAKNSIEKCGLETSSSAFLILKESLVKKESEGASMLIWTNFNSFAITYNPFNSQQHTANADVIAVVI